MLKINEVFGEWRILRQEFRRIILHVPGIRKSRNVHIIFSARSHMEEEVLFSTNNLKYHVVKIIKITVLPSLGTSSLRGGRIDPLGGHIAVRHSVVRST